MLVSRPPTAFFIPQLDLKYIESLGFLHTGINDVPKFADFDQNKISKYYSEFDPYFSKMPRWLSHGWVSSSWESIRNQVLLFDHPPVKVADTSVQKWAEDQIVEMLELNKVYSTVLPLDQVEWNFTATPGFGIRDNYKTKGDFLLQNRNSIDEYWNQAHELDYESLWKLSGKNEFLPWKKIYADDQRCFEIPDTYKLSFDLRCVQSFNKRMIAAVEDLPIKVGTSFQRGGLHRLLSELERKYEKFGMGDIQKWDKNYLALLRLSCKRIRLRMFRVQKEDGSFIEVSANDPRYLDYQKRLDWIYKTSINTPIICPWGQVLRILDFMKSGDANTTTDNSIGHLMLELMYIKTFLPNVSNWREAFEVYYPNLYSDDYIFAVQGSAGEFLSRLSTRQEFLSRWGFKLKEEDDQVQDNLEGLTFLGATFRKVDGVWLPAYDSDRIVSSLVLRGARDLEPFEHYCKVYALLILSHYDVPLFNWIRNYLLFLVNSFQRNHKDWLPRSAVWAQIVSEITGMNVVGLDHPLVPTLEFVRRFWSGSECPLWH